jgi:hypothetical protein
LASESTRVTATKVTLTKVTPTKAMPTRATLTDRRCAHMGTTPIIPIPVHRMASTVRSGLQVEYSSVPDLGITGVMVGTGVVVDIGVAAASVMPVGAMDAVTPGVTDGAMPGGMRAGTMGAAMLVAAPHAATPEVMDSMVEAPSAAAVDTMAEAPSAVAEVGVGSMVAADPTVADTANGQYA